MVYEILIFRQTIKLSYSHYLVCLFLGFKVNNQIVWLDMPVLNLDRATKFYAAILNGEVVQRTFEQYKFAVLPHSETSVSGCLIESPADEILTKGPLIYFNVNGRLDEAIALVSQLGGDIIQEKHAIGPHGFRAIIHDSEGNRIALHSSIN